MTLLPTLRSLFIKDDTVVVNDNKGSTKQFLSRISGAFMLPISVMAIAGLFLGIGAIIQSHAEGNQAAITFGGFLANLGNPVFNAIPALFMIAIIVSFTEDIGTAVFTGVVAYLVFNAIQLPFISTRNVNGITLATILYSVNPDIDSRFANVTGTNLGITSLNTSVFGGIVVGFLAVWCYKKFHQVELPTAISFFGGKRFVAFAAIVLVIPLAFAFLLVWPWFGTGLAYFGEYSGKIYGLDSFIFGYGVRALLPFGMHHVFYATLWYTQAGGAAGPQLAQFIQTHTFAPATDIYAAAVTNGLTSAPNYTYLSSIYMGDRVGDINITQKILGLPFNEVQWFDAGNASVVHSAPVFDFFVNQLGMNPGRFTTGGFGFYAFALPFVCLAMYFAAPKGSRKLAGGVLFPAALTAFAVGVTEPIEFTFVFLAPALYWGFYCVVTGLSGLFLNLAGVHIGANFSSGIVEYILYGVVPFQKGTNFWWALVVSAGNAGLFFGVFYWAIRRFNLDTPGRGANSRLITKAEWKASKAEGGIDPRAAAIVDAYGGWDNIVKTANCATRLRYDVKDAKLVSEEKLKAAGAFGVQVTSPTHVQAIMGTKAETLNGLVEAARKARSQKDAAAAPAASAGK